MRCGPRPESGGQLQRDRQLPCEAAHFHDWNNLDRVAEVSLQGRLIGTLEEYNGAGVWLAFPVTAQDSAGRKLVLSARPTHANTMITQIVLVPEE